MSMMFFRSCLAIVFAAAGVAASGGVFDVAFSEVFSYNKSMGNQYFDQYYLADAEFGTPPQKFALVIDTGSPDTWVQSKPITPGPVFSPHRSSSFRNLTTFWQFQYGGPMAATISKISGYAAQDTIAIGDGQAPLTLTKETFGVATDSYEISAPFTEGFLGLTYSARVSSYNAPVYVRQAITRGLLASRLFGIRLSRAQDARPALTANNNSSTLNLRRDAGKITFGGVDTSQFTGPITYAPLQTDDGFWQIALDGMYVNNKLIAGTAGFPTIIDTGTSGIILPPKVAKDLFTNHYNGTPIGPDDIQYSIPCKTSIDIKFKIGGTMFPIKAQDINQGNIDSEDCLTSIIGLVAENASRNGTYPSKAPEVIVLGLPLMLNTYTIFDYTHGSRMGFATLADNGRLPAIARIDVAERAPE